MMPAKKLTLALALVAAVLVTGCSDSSDRLPATNPPEPPEPLEAVDYSATVHRTEGGFPHIIASDFGSLGYGTGFAAAEDNFCIMAENVLRVRGQLPEFLGPDGGNLNSDLFRAWPVCSWRQYRRPAL